MTLFLLFVFIVVSIILFSKDKISSKLGEYNKLVLKLKNTSWFQNHLMSGIFLFIMNATLFFTSCLLIYLLTYLLIPFLDLLVMVLAVFGSFFLWMIVNKAWQGSNANRIKMSILGSSFYILLSILFLFWLLNLEPSNPGEDLFMRSLGLMIGLVVSIVAFLSCLITTGFSFKRM
ncbi:hypothetical protein [Bacillus sp. UNCCL81]|uniref:hypothetical protein n=1 Tax=Bacillus sp. UNCCL81 TaxID=1502755 RepID=UPI0008EE4595|nr:hypothetical protein [Bacillus sp. UNCCL81]SFC96875.1 hypothetical protein SAMN02799633_02187 [Bacillus sp. UNCCL81]